MIKEDLLAFGLNGLSHDADIPLEKICTWQKAKDGTNILRYTPPIDINAIFRHHTERTFNSMTLEIAGIGNCNYVFEPGLVQFSNKSTLKPKDIIAYYSGLEAFDEKIKREEEEIRRKRRYADEKEKQEIAKRILQKQRRRELEKIVRQELIDSGDLFKDQPKRPPIPREVVDAVYSRDKGVCVYCGSKENLQLDHIIPFSKGGATTIENLQLLCQKCNLEKSNHIG